MATLPNRRPPGRPKVPDGARKRNNVTIRMRDELKSKVERSAASQQRSISEEIEVRLERSFVEEGAFGDPEMRRLAYRMATVFAMEGQFSAAGNPDWLHDRDCYLAGLIGVLDALLIGMPGATHEDVALVIESLKGRLMTRFVREQNK